MATAAPADTATGIAANLLIVTRQRNELRAALDRVIKVTDQLDPAVAEWVRAVAEGNQ